MAYISQSDHYSGYGGLGCGSGACQCSSCQRSARQLGETYEPEDEDDRGRSLSGYSEAPTLPADRACAQGPAVARDRCQTQQPCPPISNLWCYYGVDGVPFEYVTAVGPDRATGLTVVTRRTRPRQERFIPGVRTAIGQFLRNCEQSGLPVEGILTAGSLYCRCIRGTNSLSNHSFGDAIDIVGVRWRQSGGPASRVPETIVHNFRDPGQRALLRRLDAALRLSFPVVIDYHHPDHQDHFHCDLAQGRGRNPRGSTTLKFAQESLGELLRRPVPITGRLDAPTIQALRQFAGNPATPIERNTAQLNETLNRLFTTILRGAAPAPLGFYSQFPGYY